MKTSTDYKQQAIDFLKQTGATLKVEYIGHDFYFPADKERRDIYRFQISRNGRRYTAKFGQSIANVDKKPTAYDILACLTKYDPGTFENFCGDFGYDEDSRTAERIYKSVVREWKGVDRLFSDVMEQLAEIQ
jgi:hypothetical protein